MKIEQLSTFIPSNAMKIHVYNVQSTVQLRKLAHHNCDQFRHLRRENSSSNTQSIPTNIMTNHKKPNLNHINFNHKLLL